MRGIVVCVHPRAAEEGAKVLENGGNAFDAAVATAFVQMVTLPFDCGVAGMMSAHLLASARKEHVIIDGCLRAGSLATADMWADGYLGEAEISGTSLFKDLRSTMGYTSICTPGTVAALGEVHRDYCTVPWGDLLQPAIDIAREGFAVTPNMRVSLTPGQASHYEPNTFMRIRANEPCAAIYLSGDGAAPEEGDFIRNPDYADTLKHLALKGPSDFYRGELASAMSDDLRSNGSFVTPGDLAEYRAVRYAPLSTTYRDFRVFSNSAPGAGPLLIEALNVLDGLDLRTLRHGDVEYLSYVASTLQLVNQDRIDHLGDPEMIGDGPLELLVSAERAEELRGLVRSGTVGDCYPPPEEADTTHLTVVDEEGNAASITHSLGNISGAVTPGLGFIYNNGMNRFDPRPGMASSIAPRKARLHLMMPSMAFRGERLAMAFGAPGGNAILSALVQAFTNVVDFGMSAVEAVTAPRVHAEGSRVWCEARTRTEVVTKLRDRGFEVVHEAASLSGTKARVQLVTVGPDMGLDGGSDPRGPMGVARSER